PLVWYTYDNLDEVVAEDACDGDTVGPADMDSTPPPPERLRGRTLWDYDEQGRVYRTREFLVNPDTGALGGSLNTDVWYGRRGQVLKVAAPGGLVQKARYDGAGRVTSAYTVAARPAADGPPTWDDAGTVTADTVLEQTDTAYDANGNPTLVKARQRF